MKNTVGVIVGRFQVDKLHEGHEELIRFVFNEHTKVIIFIGISQAKSSFRNPLDFENQKQVILEKFPKAIVSYIRDEYYDKVWSKILDEKIYDIIGPNEEPILYGGRDSFISFYSGKYSHVTVDSNSKKSGTKIRAHIGKSILQDSAFRSGIIWSSQNRYINPIPTVDIAILNEENTEILLCRKPNLDKFQFIGGFVDPGETIESAAKRETFEETGLEVSSIQYIGSCVIDDWRYRNEPTNIITTLFKTIRLFGKATPRDDVEELKWFKIEDFEKYVIPFHFPLVGLLKGL